MFLTYEIRGRKGTVSYTVSNDGAVKFTFRTPDGKTSTEEYAARPSRGSRQGPQGVHRVTTTNREMVADDHRAKECLMEARGNRHEHRLAT